MGKSRKRQNKLKSTQDPDVSITLSQADTNDFEGDSILQQDKNIEMEAFEHEDSGINLNKKNYKITQVDVNQIIPDEEQENAVENENETQFDEQEQEEEEEEEVESIENGKSNQENEVKNKKITNFDFLEDVEVVENTQKNEEVSEESDDEAPEEITLSKGKQIIEDMEKQKKEYDLK
ncbi:hypothetical protein K502DRAFT_158863 [Neoconidiobolus thromboides FSU 785]|nr:hypothetical protein K502DRAFT_158863 [Neoconidiobolus thromboides FSU 785]